jgi:isopenicillin-N N-acyltransferase-like protein
MPAVLEEIQGIAEGARIAYRYAFVAAVRDMMDAGGCTSVALSGAGHPAGPVIGQTRDTSGSSSRFHIMRIQYDSGRSMVLLNYPGWIANTGITSDGLAFAGFSLFAAAPDKPTVPGSFRKRLVLEARSTAEVLDQISGLSFPNGGLLIGDRSGHMACVEMVAGRVAVRDVSGMALGHSNSICITEMKQFEAIIPDASSDLRRVNIERILSEQGGNISIKSLKAAFRDHTGFPLSICRHNSPTDTWITSAAFVADLKALEIHIAIGSPCTSPFVRYTATA